MVDGWSDPRRRILYQETRNVIAAQRESAVDIEGKALQIVRLDAVLIGLLIATARFDDSLVSGPLITCSIVLLSLSSLLGLVTIDDSNLFTGLSGAYVLELNHTERASWDGSMVTTFGYMIRENERAIRRSATLLKLTTGCLIAGIIAAVSGAGF